MARPKTPAELAQLDAATASEHDHLRNHLTDGRWHDGCSYCLDRRLHGGNGVVRVVAEQMDGRSE